MSSMDANVAHDVDKSLELIEEILGLAKKGKHGSLGADQVRAVKQHYGEFDALDELIALANNPNRNFDHLPGMDEAAKNAEYLVRESERIVESIRAEGAGIQANISAEVVKDFENIYADPYAALENYQKIVEAENPELAAKEIAQKNLQAHGGGRRAMEGFEASVESIREEMAKEGIDINDDGLGRQMLARKLIQQQAGLYGELKGSKGMLGEDAARKAAKQAAAAFDPDRAELRVLDSQYAAHLTNLELSENIVEQTKQDADKVIARSKANHLMHNHDVVKGYADGGYPQQAEKAPAQEPPELEEGMGGRDR